MKKILLVAAITTFAVTGLLVSKPVYADLQCWTPPYTSYVNVQNASQCASENGGRLYDTFSGSWTNPTTGTAVYPPGDLCVGLAPAYRTSDPGVDGSCMAGYKLGEVTRDQNGNIVRINYADGSVETVNRDPSGNIIGTTYTPRPVPTPTQNPATPAQGGSNTGFCGNNGQGGVSCTYTPLEPLPGLPTSYGTSAGFANLVGNGYKLLLGLGSIIAVVILVIGGLSYMFSDVINTKMLAKSRIRNAFWAILILASSWLILNTINPQLVNFNLNINPLPGGTTGVANNPSITGVNNGTQTSPTVQEINSCESAGGHYTLNNNR